MNNRRRLIALIACAAGAAEAQAIHPLIVRPLTLPRGAVQFAVDGAYSNFSRILGPEAPGSLAGETLSLGADFGVTDRVQLGAAVALPVNPGAAFGSLLASAVLAFDPRGGVRIDAGFERPGVNGDPTAARTGNTTLWFGGLGLPVKLPLGPAVALVSGRAAAVDFGHFRNVGSGPTGLYFGAMSFAGGTSDILTVSGEDGLTRIGINLPAGFLLQPDPRFALTLLAGYSASVTDSGGRSEALHFVPVGVEAVVSPAAPLDVGLRFLLDGLVAGWPAGGPGYFDLRNLV
ncbi:MAG TPA: hypothetical protein VI356_13645, partial [Myxococcales bacterium]